MSSITTRERKEVKRKPVESGRGEMSLRGKRCQIES
jgi:hypothetical protein